MSRGTGHEPLLQVAAKGNLGLLRKLLELGINVNTQDEDGWTPLMEAAWNGQLEAAMLLLQHGANPLIKNKEGYTALRFSEVWGRKEMTELLKKAEALYGERQNTLH
jgi:ankyrin repeat protein